MAYVACVDVGSTWTKAVAVARDSGALLATASVPTSTGPGRDVLTGLDAVLDRLTAAVGQRPGQVRACSSAGGGLRLAVVGYERVVTAEAGQRVALSAGAKVVHVAAGRLDRAGLGALRDAAPDVVLLVGGTDGGDAETLLHNGSLLARHGPRVPYVVAGNAVARSEVLALLGGRGRTVVGCANVLPRIGVLDPLPAREAIRDVFVRHVIGGKGLSTGTRFARLVRGATPDLVLAGVEVLAAELGEDVLLVDVGGATTDVYSVLTPDPEEASLRREVVEVVWHGRTVEGDLGVRWGASSVVRAAVAERLVAPERVPLLDAAARRRHADVGYLPQDETERDLDAELATLAAVVAVRRHARPVVAGQVRTPGRDLSHVRLVVGSGGVFRHATDERLATMFDALSGDVAGGWRRPEAARRVVDRAYVLAAVGLLAADEPATAAALARTLTEASSRPGDSPARRAAR